MFHVVLPHILDTKTYMCVDFSGYNFHKAHAHWWREMSTRGQRSFWPHFVTLTYPHNTQYISLISDYAFEISVIINSHILLYIKCLTLCFPSRKTPMKMNDPYLQMATWGCAYIRNSLLIVRAYFVKDRCVYMKWRWIYGNFVGKTVRFPALWCVVVLWRHNHPCKTAHVIRKHSERVFYMDDMSVDLTPVGMRERDYTSIGKTGTTP